MLDVPNFGGFEGQKKNFRAFFLFLTNESLHAVNFSTDDISKIINNLDPNKAHSRDMLSIYVVPVHKKGDKHCLKNYRPISYFQSAAKFLNVSFIMSFSPYLLIIT